jgi:hypothetical protein
LKKILRIRKLENHPELKLNYGIAVEVKGDSLYRECRNSVQCIIRRMCRLWLYTWDGQSLIDNHNRTTQTALI